MIDNNVPANEATDPQSAVESDDDKAARLFENIFGDPVDASEEAPQEIVEEDIEESEVVEEDSEIVESDDTEEYLEADDAEEDETTDDPVDADMDFESLAEQVEAIDFGNGAIYTPAQLAALVGQGKAASTKAREADAKLKEAEATLEKATQAEEWIKNKIEQVNGVDELASKAQEVQYWQQQVAIAEGADEGFKAMRELQAAQSEYASLEAQTNQLRNDVFEKTMGEQTKLLQDSGFGEAPASEAWQTYAQDNLSDTAKKMINSDASLVIALEKARLYDKAQTKTKATGKKLASKKTLTKRGSAPKPSSTSSKENQARRKRFKNGEITESDIDNFGRDMMNDLFG